jgi:hypothetical protein
MSNQLMLALAALALIIGACTPTEGIEDPTTCAHENSLKAQPRDTTIAAGTSFQLRMELITCHRSGLLPDSVMIFAARSEIISVDRYGTVIGHSAGMTTIAVTSDTYRLNDSVRVTVR